jgi:hypothetical protein
MSFEPATFQWERDAQDNLARHTFLFLPLVRSLQNSNFGFRELLGLLKSISQLPTSVTAADETLQLGLERDPFVAHSHLR